MRLIRNVRRLPLRDVLTLATVFLVSSVFVVAWAFSQWTAAIEDGKNRFRGQTIGFFTNYYAEIHRSLSRGQMLWLALNDDGQSVNRSSFANFCAQLGYDGFAAGVELVVLEGASAGRYRCGVQGHSPLLPQDSQTRALLLRNFAKGSLIDPASSTAAVAGEAPHLEWVSPIGMADAAGKVQLTGYIRLRYRLQQALDRAMQDQPTHAEYALDVGNALNEGDERRDAYPPKPMLQSAQWPPGQFSARTLGAGQLVPQWFTFYDNVDYPMGDGKVYRLTLFQRSPVLTWLEWPAAGTLSIVLGCVLVLLITGMSYALLFARMRMRRTVELRTLRLKRRSQALQHARHEQGLLEAALLDTTEREKLRLGAELHDGAGQSLTGARLLADSLALTLHPVPPLLTALQKSLQTAINAVREGARGLTPAPLLEDGLEPALAALARQYDNSSVRVELQSHAPLTALDPESKLHIYRIAQEAINNAVRHGGARKVTLTLGGAQLLQVEDDGQGFEPEGVKTGVGLRSQQMRAGLMGRKLVLRSQPGAGSVVCLQ
ncbi:sensor histidine kinase [Rhodoferax aquaticus]|uniref:histidine kinase n=1 Tax=Rhodoferax aquaticus TaxID=2527691 RepID=A0A515EMR3_9BURK|nr:sensor histidine kinase [Rhodoferax aquaticus]QDL53959.1 sensor histidine kinase [Rhodoferax aquaticus]